MFACEKHGLHQQPQCEFCQAELSNYYVNLWHEVSRKESAMVCKKHDVEDDSVCPACYTEYYDRFVYKGAIPRSSVGVSFCRRCGQDEANKKLRKALDDMAEIPGFDSKRRSSFIASFWQGYDAVKAGNPSDSQPYRPEREACLLTSKMIHDILDSTKENAMKTPTQEQLQDPEWWRREAPEGATHYCTDLPGFCTPKHPKEMCCTPRPAKYQSTDTKATPCRVCGESPCGHYNECPPGTTREERLKRLEAERDAFLAEDAKAEAVKAQPKEWGIGTTLEWSSEPLVNGNIRFTAKAVPIDDRPDSRKWVDGLPPAGCECEAEYHTYRQEWYKARILAHDENKVIGRWLSGPKQGELFEYTRKSAFRPLKTDAEREREKQITAIQTDSQGDMGSPISATQAINLYDAGYRRPVTPDPFPARAVSVTFAHPTIGDMFFRPLIHEAEEEFFKVDPVGTLTEYQASNGVRVSVTGISPPWPRKGQGETSARGREAVIEAAKSHLGNLRTNIAIAKVLDKLYDAGLLCKPQQSASRDQVRPIIHRAWLESGTGDESAEITDALLDNFDVLRKGGE